MLEIKVGIPKGLLYVKYKTFYRTFFEEVGAEIIESSDTTKSILNQGVETCVSEACLPLKIFHGHVNSIKNQCDIVFIPRIMKVKTKEYICPKYCGIPEMIKSSIPDMPCTLCYPMYFNSNKEILKWAKCTGSLFCNSDYKIRKALKHAI